MAHIPLQSPVLRRIPFIGRNDILGQIDEIVKNAIDKPTIIFVEGYGGIGKTEVLKQVLQRYTESKHDWLVARDVVDVYHPDVRTELGFSDQVLKVLPEDVTAHFAAFHDSRMLYRSQTLSGSGDTKNIPLKTVIDDFRTALRTLTQERHVLIAVDTAEKLTESLSAELSMAPSFRADGCNWFCELLSSARKIVVLVAGRPEIRRLSDAIRKVAYFESHHIEVRPFDSGECRDYVKSACRHLRELGYQDEVRRLEHFDTNRGQETYAITGGDPISLALMVDLIAWAGFQWPVFFDDSATVGETRHQEFQRLYILRMKNSTLGGTIDTLSYLQRGCTPNLFAHMSGMPIDEATEILSSIEHLSIVKVREDIENHTQLGRDGVGIRVKRYYLHDEVYLMMRRWIHNNPTEAPKLAHKRELARSFCDGELGNLHQTLSSEYRTLHQRYSYISPPNEQEVQPHFDKIAEANEVRQGLLVEALHYALQQNADRGLKRYCRYMLEAIQVGDVTLERELESALDEFLADTTNDEVLASNGRYNNAAQEMRHVWECIHLWVSEQYQELIDRSERIVMTSNEPRNNYISVLNIWRAYAHIFLGEDETALGLLDESISKLMPTTPREYLNLAEQPFDVWYAAVIGALALRIKGYLLRSTGKLRLSLPHYKQSIRLYDGADVQVELAVALNDFGLIQTELGEQEAGRNVVSRGLEIRRRFGSPSHVAYSMNTLALVNIADDMPDIAIREAEQARIVFRRLGFDRGEGLALLTLAEAYRELAKSEMRLAKYDDCTKRLDDAIECAGQALGIFEKTDELSRIVQANMEIGRANREMVRIRRELTAPDQSIKDFSELSEQALGRAATLSKGVSSRWEVDAWVNLAWLGNYAKNEDLLFQAVITAQQLIETHYGDYLIDSPKIPKGKPSIPIEVSEMWVWEQIGKLYMARADWYFALYDISNSQHSQSNLGAAVRDYAYALEHNGYGRNAESYHAKRAKDRLASRMERLSRDERHEVGVLLTKWEEEFLEQSEGSVMREFLEQNAIL